MNYQFTPECRTALERARPIAHDLGHDFIGPVHLALALLGDGAVQSILARIWTTPWAVRSALLGTQRPGGPPAGGEVRLHTDQLPYTSRAKKSLELALRYARDHHGDSVTTRDLLLGVLRADPAVSRAFESLGLTLTSIHATEHAPGPGWSPGSRRPPGPVRPSGPTSDPSGPSDPGAGPATPGSNVPADPAAGAWFLQLDADDSSPIYEQIVRNIEEAVATGALLEGERLPTVRQLAEELSIAPGTVARAYAALEERGVVEADGARGTRVAQQMRARANAESRLAALEAQLRPIVVGAYHMGAGGGEVMEAVKRAMRGVY